MKRVLAMVGICVVCALLCGCAANEKPIAPPDESGVFTISSTDVGSLSSVPKESSIVDSDVFSTDGSSSVEQSLGSVESSGNVVIADPALADITISMGDDFFIVGWAFEEAGAAGWKYTLDEDKFVAPQTVHNEWIELEKNGKVVFVSVYNNDTVSPKRLRDCQIYSASTEESGAIISHTTTGEVVVGMSASEAEIAMSLAQSKAMNNGYRSYLSKFGDAAYYFYFNPNTDEVIGVGIAIPTLSTGEIFA